MLRVEVDVFSGRPNPEWILTDPAASDAIVTAAANYRAAVAEPDHGFGGLGFREVTITQLSDVPRDLHGLPRAFALGSAAADDYDASKAMALEAVATMDRGREPTLPAHELTPLSADLLEFVSDRIRRAVRVRRGPIEIGGPSNPRISSVPDPTCSRCQYEMSEFNPGFWNRPFVQPHNNCYNYARNWRTDTFAQPGRASGHPVSALTCAAVTGAAIADGLVPRCTCLPANESPRRLMALVIDPGNDYHWYRDQRDGFWGHKPGRTPAINTDNSGKVITDPERCDRDGYTDFCGFFYAGRSVVIA